MNLSIKATNLDLTPAIKEYALDKFGHLEKFIKGAIETKIELERDRKNNSGEVFRAEVTMFVGGKVIRADARAEDMYAAIDFSYWKKYC